MLFDRTYIKTKALFQIFLIVFVVFSLTVIEPKKVEAQQQNVCCSETVSGEHCVYTQDSNCAPGAQKAAASCEQTSFCKLGCGFDQNEGICFNNMPKFSCEAKEGCQWSPSAQCDIPQCNKGCCVLSNQCSFTTQVQCKQITSQFEDINMTFDEGITSELECINQCRSFERGACVHEDASCEFTTRENCQEATPDLSNATLPLIGFHPDTLCSNAKLGTECAPQQKTGCLAEEDEVYWFDSCGNPENIYSSDKVSSYNGGFILAKEASCGFGGANINSETCGNCNYASGSLCAVAEPGVDPAFGDYACKSLLCDVNIITKDPNSPASLNPPLENGESWCAYDGLVGANENAGLGLDLAGSRHYRRICINGQELTEPCKDFREEICVQGEIDFSLNPALQQVYGTQESFGLGAGDNIIAGACRANRMQECSSIFEKEACENLAQRDCLWLLGETKEGNKNFGVACVPLVSPGLKHWTGESSTTTSKLDPKTTCEAGNTECEVTFFKEGIGGSWECVGGCECLTANYLEQANSVCKSLGDCGAWYNIAGEKTCSGLVDNLNSEILTVKGDPEVCDKLPPFGDLQGFSGGGTATTGFALFWERSSTPAMFMALIGIGTSLWGGGNFFSGAFGGASTGAGLLKDVGNWIGGQKFVFTNTNLAFTESYGVGFETAKNSISVGTKIGEGTFFQSSEIVTKLNPNVLATKFDPITAGDTIVGYQAKPNILLDSGDFVSGQSALTPSVIVPSTLQNILLYVNTFLFWYAIYQLINALLSDTITETITVECNPWVAPVGGDNCELCQEKGKECSEYRCKSLGQSCGLVNVGTEEEKCISTNVNDVVPPYITVDKEVIVQLTDSVDNVAEISEVPGKGFEIIKKIAPFTAVTLALDTNEYAQCKFDLNHGLTYEEMAHYFGDSLFSTNHTMTFSLPSALATDEALKLTNGGQYQIYVKCQDGNGNSNEADYFAKFKIDEGPDFTPPVIEATSIDNGGFVPAGINQTLFAIYANEPSTCKWDDVDVAFADMFNSFTCKNGAFPTSSLYYGLFECSTVLTGIQDAKKNNYFFRCEDKKNNVNAESYFFSLQGTVPLKITSVDPDDNKELKFNSPVLKVVTSGGAFGNGDATCGYNFDSPGLLDSIEFLNTNSSVHEQPFFNLTAGDYNVYINCLDLAGNFANETAEFNIVVDTFGPKLMQVYTAPGILHLVTEEPTVCEYSVDSSFSYGNGIPMTGANTEEHTASLEGKIYYVVCADNFNNLANYVIYL